MYDDFLVVLDSVLEIFFVLIRDPFFYNIPSSICNSSNTNTESSDISKSIEYEIS